MVLVNDILFCGQNTRSPGVVPTLSPLDTHELTHLPPEPNWWTNESLFVRVDNGPFPDQVNFVWFDEFSLLEDLPEDEQRWNEELHGVVREEARDAPGHIGRPAVVTGSDEHPDEGEPRTVWLEPTDIGELLAIKALCFAGAPEAYVGYRHHNVIDET